MNQNSANRQAQCDLNQRSSQQGSKATGRKQHQEQQRQLNNEQTSEDQIPDTPSGQSRIEAPMSGSKMCGHVYDCDCSTEQAIHASEEHAPKK
ncbi:hypothetical protein BGZ98_004047 [Dissophora globulifera]|nr:hypothetical protein BGZ98_004047 [Dissophora globulifera]